MSFAPKIDILLFIMTKLHVCENHQQNSLLKGSKENRYGLVFLSDFVKFGGSEIQSPAIIIK